MVQWGQRKGAVVNPGYEIHELAHLLPAMQEAEFAELREDIAANGLQQPITLYQGRILDGRHRQRACDELGLTPTYCNYEGETPAAFVLSLNVKRRQITQSQKAMLATDFLPHLQAESKRGAHFRTLPRDERGHTVARPDSESKDSESVRSAAQAADQVGVGHAQVVRANKVKREDPELAERVRNGEVTVGAAHAIVTTRDRLADRTAALRGERKLTPPALDSDRGQVVAAAHKRRLIEFVSSLTGYSRGLSAINTDLLNASMEQQELDEWARQLGDALTKFRKFRAELQKGRNQS